MRKQIIGLGMCLFLTAPAQIKQGSNAVTPTAKKSTHSISLTEQKMIQQGMVDVQKMDSSFFVRLMYAKPDNFTHQTLYTNLHHAYLHPQAAEALCRAQRLLKQKHPEWNIVIYDATRPMSIQQKMWNVVKGTSQSIYVSNPANGGGLHNYGLAVDVSICNEKGDSIAMGTLVDHLGKEAHIDTEDEMLRMKHLSKEAYQNRRLLREVMRQAGFKPLRTEWWHFNFKSRAEAKAHYKVIP